MRRPWGSTKAAVIAALSELGPLTRTEICRELGLDRELVSSVISRVHLAGGLHIAGYVMDDEAARRYPRAQYAVGPGRDAKRPVSKKSRVSQASQKTRRTRIQTSSVFNLGLTRAQCWERRRVAIGGGDGQDQQQGQGRSR